MIGITLTSQQVRTARLWRKVLASQQLTLNGQQEPAFAAEPRAPVARSSGKPQSTPLLQPSFDGREAAA